MATVTIHSQFFRGVPDRFAGCRYASEATHARAARLSLLLLLP